MNGIDGKEHKVGDNSIVKKIWEEINDCQEACYIAIVPKSDVPSNHYPYVRHIYWEDLNDNELTKSYLQKTIEFNASEEDRGRGVSRKKVTISQILNNF